jgi:CDGSH-type Zn-finger protein
MAEPVCAKKSPYVIELEAGTYYWCACGQSINQPFCDGSHKGTKFTPVQLKLTETTKVPFCGCKRTNDAPRCDGTHKSILD